MFLQSVLAALALSSPVALAAPSRPHAMYVPGMARGSSPEDKTSEQPKTFIAKLPGYNHMLRNESAPSSSAPSATGANPMAADAVFGGQCRGLKLGGHGKKGQTTLEATCIDGEGQWWYTTLNLNSCLGNGEGSLVYEYMGNFDDSCRPCILGKDSDSGDALLKCNCLPKPDGVPQYTDILLGLAANDELAVRPVGGRLVCGSHEGTKSPGFGPSNVNGEQTPT